MEAAQYGGMKVQSPSPVWGVTAPERLAEDSSISPFPTSYFSPLTGLVTEGTTALPKHFTGEFKVKHLELGIIQWKVMRAHSLLASWHRGSRLIAGGRLQPSNCGKCHQR